MSETKNENELKVNQFPTLTWNFLHINNSAMHADASAFDTSCALAETELPAGVSCADGDSETLCTCGMGAEVDALFDAAKDKIPSSVYTVESGAKAAVVRLSYLVEDGDKVLTDVVIKAGANSESTFIFDTASEKSAAGFAGFRTQIIAEENAVVNIVKVQLLGENVENFEDIGSKIADSAKVNIIELSLGGKKSWIGNYAATEGYKSLIEGKVAYVCRGEQELDINYVAHQTGQESNSKMSVDGVMMGKSRKTWRGTIDFVNGAKGATGDEQEDVLLLDESVHNKSLPVILCDEEDVEGRHGASVGSLGADLLFYMQTRGVDAKTAQEMMIKAKITSLCRFIPDENLVSRIADYVEESFGNE